MGELEPRIDSIFEGSFCKSCKCSPYHGQVSVGEDQHNYRNVKNVEMGLLQSDTDTSSDDEALLLKGLENLHIEQAICSPTSNKMISQISSPNTTELLSITNCATMLCSQVLQSCAALSAKPESSTIDLGYQSYSSVQNDAEGGMPFHAPSKLLSAIKGSRARHGKPLNQNLHVKWAADVYDPPVTSSSHTVKGHRHHHHHHHRPAKAKKDYHKHKHAKTKPANMVLIEKRSYQRRSSSSSILDSPMSRLPALPSISFSVDILWTVKDAAGSGRIQMGR